MRVIFDLDGTLVDTKEAVKHAYLMAGVRMPDDAWGKPFGEWCQDLAAHRRKQEVYPITLQKFARRLPLMDVLLGYNQPFEIITGASLEATLALRRAGLLPSLAKVQATALSKAAKAHWLAVAGWGTYVDDDLEVRTIVKELTTWKVQDPTEYLASCSPPAPTPV